MQALYTELLSDFLADESQSVAWQAIVTKFGKFPTFTLGNLSYTMYDLFIDKFEIREIGSETRSIFVHNVNDKVNELLIKYVPKIQMYISNFTKLMDRTVELDKTAKVTNSGTDTSNGNNDTLLYPVSTTQGKVASRDESSGSMQYGKVVDTSETNEQQMMIFKTNPEILEQAMNIKDIYLDCLNEFEPCFMGIY